jgi:hypothetical protein
MSATRSEMEGFARDCMMLALSTTDPVARERLLQMAREWMETAMEKDEPTAPRFQRPNEKAPA